MQSNHLPLRCLGLALLLATSFTTAPVAAVQQPNATTIPNLINQNGCNGGDIQGCLDLSEGTPNLIGAVADALVAPETFEPTCALTFTPLVKGGGNAVAFGWYNVKPDPDNAGQFLAPDETERFGMVSFSGGDRFWGNAAFTPVTLDLAAELAAGRYLGGEIGFFLIGDGSSITTFDPETHLIEGGASFFYTQHALNPGASGPWYQVLTWQSVAFENAFYFGWEDLVASSWSDNDFDDLAFLVTGIQCSGGGEACDTGLLGQCALGTMQCTKGELMCLQSVQPEAEQCNALDDDCNGDVDEGDLCAENEVCLRGVCSPRCGSGEFRCDVAGTVCSEGLCLEESCVGVECPAGEVCQGGACVDACEGITCPHGRLCRNGGCIDPCVSVTCDEGFTCVLGVCESCGCSACPEGTVCHENLCVDEGCESQTCAPATHCAAGVCVDNCEGTLCPAGQICETGECIPDPNATTGEGGGGAIIIDPNGSGGTAAAGGTANTGDGGNGGVGSTAGKRTATESSGCACTVPGGRGQSIAALGALFVALAAGVRRRRGRRS